MNIFMWILQAALAVHTVLGAVWKFSNTAEQAVPSLAALPHSVWIGMAIFELLCAAGLIIPAFKKNLAILAPVAAIGIALEMLAMSAVHLFSGETNHGPVIYWLVVALICVFIAVVRIRRR